MPSSRDGGAPSAPPLPGIEMVLQTIDQLRQSIAYYAWELAHPIPNDSERYAHMDYQWHRFTNFLAGRLHYCTHCLTTISDATRWIWVRNMWHHRCQLIDEFRPLDSFSLAVLPTEDPV